MELDFNFEVKSLTDEGQFSGYGSVFNNTDSTADIVAPGAFKNSLKLWKQAKRLPPMLWQHRSDQPLGRFNEMSEDKKGLYVEGQLALSVQRSQEAYDLLKMEALNGLSIGYRPVKSKYDEDENIRTLIEIDLWEVSVVTFPANDAARIGAVKAALRVGEMPTNRDVEALLRDAGYTRTQAKEAIRYGFKNLIQRDAGSNEVLDSATALLKTISTYPYPE